MSQARAQNSLLPPLTIVPGPEPTRHKHIRLRIYMAPDILAP